jgi:pimeloyl-[acyl-carrier protein] methyl ester esterase
MTSAIFIPGWAASPLIWQPLANALGDVLASEIIPWQDAVFGEPRPLHARLAAASAPMILGGWSLGTLAALEAALAHPGKVKALILVSPTARLPADRDYPGSDPRACRAMRAKLQNNPEQLLRDFATLSFYPREAARFCDAFVVSGMMQDRGDLQKGLDYLNTTDLRARLGEISLPVMLLHGSDDRIVPAGSAQYLRDHLRQVRLAEIPGAGHTVLASHAAELATEIRHFLNTLD